jgi:hypothetical protein
METLYIISTNNLLKPKVMQIAFARSGQPAKFCTV